MHISEVPSPRHFFNPPVLYLRYLLRFFKLECLIKEQYLLEAAS